MHDVPSFMGIMGYYRRFIEVLFRIAYPITSLMKNMTKFDWDKKCQGCLDNLKHLLTTTSVLKIVDPYKEFVVCTYASKKGHGGVLL